MPTLLHVDSSPIYGQSVSRELTNAFVEQWQSLHPGHTILRRDLTATSIPPISAAWVGASFTPADQRTPEQQVLLALSESLIVEIEQADEIVLGVAMHNFSIPAVLKLWIDQIVRAGRTTAVVDGKPQGLIRGKKVTVILATGGDYSPASPIASWNFVEPYLRHILAYIGIFDITFYTVGGTKALFSGVNRSGFLAPHRAALRLPPAPSEAAPPAAA